MKETTFIDQNKAKWREFEEEFKSPQGDPEKLTNLFVQITDDLSYARTHYPHRSVRIYLNRIAQQVYFSIYKNRLNRWNKFKHFWSDELPEVMHHSRRELLFSTVIFLLALGVGVLSSIHDGEFARLILGDSYISMTEENIRSGDPMKVYKESQPNDMFLAITTNNLKVAFFSFILGVTFGMGTLYILLYNGIMVGAFQYFFVERALFRESFLTIWIHGTMEMSAIVIAATAGFIIGRSLLFPGTFSRLASFRQGGVRAMKVFMGIIPIIITAGFLESYFTRHTDTPDLIRALIIFAEFAFMITYYVIYPARRARKGFQTEQRPDELLPVILPEVKFDRVLRESEVYTGTFSLFRRHLKALLTWSISFAALVTLAGFFDHSYMALNPFRKLYLGELHDLISPGNSLTVFCLHVLSMAFVMHLSVALVFRTRSGEGNFRQLFTLRLMLPALLAGSIWALLFLMPLTASTVLQMLLLPIPVYLICAWQLKRTGERLQPFIPLSRQYGSILMVVAVLFITVFILMLLLDTSVSYFYSELLQWMFSDSFSMKGRIISAIMQMITLASYYLLFSLIVFGLSLMFFSGKEIVSAGTLKAQIDEAFI